MHCIIYHKAPIYHYAIKRSTGCYVCTTLVFLRTKHVSVLAFTYVRSVSWCNEMLQYIYVRMCLCYQSKDPREGHHEVHLQSAMDFLQLCTRQDAGCEAAVHAMAHVYDVEDTEAVIFVDAANVFNRLNRQVTLSNTQVICPALAPSRSTHITILPGCLWMGSTCCPKKEPPKGPLGHGHVRDRYPVPDTQTTWHR